MKRVDFEQYAYCPALRTRNAELKGLSKLDLDRKSSILPLITLGKWPKSDDFSRSVEKAAEAMGNNPFFIDLPSDPRHHSDTSIALIDPKRHFEAWRKFAEEHESAIPIIQTAHGTRRDIVQQARRLEADCGRIGFRIRDFNKDTPLVVAALSALDRVSNALVFVDAQYIRSSLPAYIAAVTTTINVLRTDVPDAIISVLSTSFPTTRTTFFDESRKRGLIQILERELHENVGGSSVAIYGDYGSIHAVVYDNQPIMRWSPTIDYALEYEWVFERRSEEATNEAGYVAAAKELVIRFPDIRSSNVWGEQMIAEAANGMPYGKSPANWIAVRVNLHLTRQIDLSSKLNDGANSDDFDQF